MIFSDIWGRSFAHGSDTGRTRILLKMAERIIGKTVDRLRPPPTGSRILYDNEIPGFGARITSKGTVSFVLNYCIRGRERRYTIGRHPIISATAAREEAIQLRGRILRGLDPLAARADDRAAATVAELARDYLTRHAEPYKHPSSVHNDKGMLDGIVLPRFGRLRVAAVDRRDVETLHHQLKGTPYRANRVLSLLSKMFSLAVHWGWRSDNPTQGIPRYHEEPRARWLTQEELERLQAALAAHPDQKAANAVRLILQTGARKGEVLCASWPEFDLERGVWTKPSHHTKQQRTEHLPLSAATVKLLRSMKKQAEGEFLFPGRDPAGPLRDLKGIWEDLCQAARLEHVRLHDLRHTYASHLVSSGVPLALVGRLLGHTQPQTTARYAHLADTPLRKAADLYARVLAGRNRSRGSPGSRPHRRGRKGSAR